jgi:hypothetical protein
MMYRDARQDSTLRDRQTRYALEEVVRLEQTCESLRAALGDALDELWYHRAVRLRGQSPEAATRRIAAETLTVWKWLNDDRNALT